MRSSGSNSPKPGAREAGLIERFLEMMSAERGAAANTLAAYERDLEAYAAFLSAKGAELSNADAGHLRQYLNALEAQGLKTTTAARRLSSVRQITRRTCGNCSRICCHSGRKSTFSSSVSAPEWLTQ